MKYGIAYTRISDEDQSNFSLSGQAILFKDFCQKNNIEILQSWEDDGYSAKDFNRPAWKELEKYLSANRNKIDFLIVPKYDRLIRNAAEGLAFIEKLEQKWNIKLLSIQENFFIDPHDPYFFKSRADMLVQAEFERRVISNRTSFGMWSARMQGRLAGKAPFGYTNALDDNSKPIILVDEQKCIIVYKMYQDYINGVAPTLIVKRAREKGFKLKAHGAIQRVLSNPVYAGLVRVPAFKDKPEKIVKAIHEAIISEDVFWKVYYRIQEEIRPHVKTTDEKLPLRGFLICVGCNMPFTGSRSKGKRSHFWYYRCLRCRNQNHSSIKIDNDIANILKGLSLEEHYIFHFQEKIYRQLDQRIRINNKMSGKLKLEYDNLKKQIDSLEQKFIKEQINAEIYEKWHGRLNKELNYKKNELELINKDYNVIKEKLKRNIGHMSQLYWIYEQASTVSHKQAFLRAIFPGCLTKINNQYRTPVIPRLFEASAQRISDLLIIERGTQPKVFDYVPLSSPYESQIEHLILTIDQILKAA